jgi:hypothetical protein
MDALPQQPNHVAPIGHNRPPPDALPGVTAEWLKAEHKDLLADFETLTARATWRKKDPKTGEWIWTDIQTEEEIKAAADIITDARPLWKRIEERRVKLKAPYDQAASTVQAFFVPLMLEEITNLGKKLTGMMTLAQNRIDAAAARRRQDLEAEAKKNEATARLITANAERAPVVKGVAAPDAAERHIERAEELRTQATLTEARPLTTATGSRVGMKDNWSGTITDLDKALAWARGIDEALVRGAVETIVDRVIRSRSADGKAQAIPGVKIENSPTANVTRRQR